MKITVREETAQDLLSPGMYTGTCTGALAGLIAPYGKPDEPAKLAVQFEFTVGVKGVSYELSTYPFTVYSRFSPKANFFKALEALNGGSMSEGDVIELPELDEGRLPSFFTKGERPVPLAYIKVNGEPLFPNNCLIDVDINKDKTRNIVRDLKPMPVPF